MILSSIDKTRKFYGFNLEKYKLINGQITNHMPYGYCNIDTHRGYLTSALVKQHECKKKQCPFLRINTQYIEAVKASEEGKIRNRNANYTLRKRWYDGEISRKEYEKLLRKIK